MTNVQAAMSEGTNMGKAYTDKNQAFVFRIPVYQNMPESAVTFADKGNPNNWLSSITVDGYALTPAFFPVRIPPIPWSFRTARLRSMWERRRWRERQPFPVLEIIR